jgi:hypothetical protein
MEDTNGNKITQLYGAPGSITDTLGRRVQTDFIYNSSTLKYELGYYDPSGTLQTIIMTKSPVTISTQLCAFWDIYQNGCKGVHGHLADANRDRPPQRDEISHHL